MDLSPVQVWDRGGKRTSVVSFFLSVGNVSTARILIPAFSCNTSWSCIYMKSTSPSLGDGSSDAQYPYVFFDRCFIASGNFHSPYLVRCLILYTWAVEDVKFELWRLYSPALWFFHWVRMVEILFVGVVIRENTESTFLQILQELYPCTY